MSDIDFPSLYVAADWIEAHAVVPDGFDRGLPFRMSDWQLRNVIHHYRVRPEAEVGDKGTAFHYRRSQIVRPQKAGKGPWAASIICLEGVGPSLFAGWAGKDDGYACSDHGCACGWEYEYDPGDPMGMPHPTPLIQITAYSEEQTDNVYGALRPMIEQGPLGDVIPKTGEEFIRLPGGGRIDTVTSSAQSRLGQRVTFVLQDETQLWTKRNKMVKVADTQRRGLAGMEGRSVETTNAFDPSEESVARLTFESKALDIYRDFPQAPANLSYTDKRERRKIHEYVYAGCPWVSLPAIEAEAAELLERDAPQAMRFFGNRIVATSGAAVDPELWDSRGVKREVKRGERIGLGFDGSISQDATILRGCTVDGYSFILGQWVRPLGHAGEGWEVDRLKVDACVREAFAAYDVGMFLYDPPKWWSEGQAWARQYGEERVVAFDTKVVRRMGPAIDRWLTALRAGTHTHDADATTSEHVKNARLKKSAETADEKDGRTLYLLAKPEDGGKIDAAVADVLAFEAASVMPAKRSHGIFI